MTEFDLLETNRRLNRRCQVAEHLLHKWHRHYVGCVRMAAHYEDLLQYSCVRLQQTFVGERRRQRRFAREVWEGKVKRWFWSTWIAVGIAVVFAFLWWMK